MVMKIAILVSFIKASEARLALKLVKKIHTCCFMCMCEHAVTKQPYVSGPEKIELTINILSILSKASRYRTLLSTNRILDTIRYGQLMYLCAYWQSDMHMHGVVPLQCIVYNGLPC